MFFMQAQLVTEVDVMLSVSPSQREQHVQSWKDPAHKMFLLLLPHVYDPCSGGQNTQLHYLVKVQILLVKFDSNTSESCSVFFF